MIIRCLALLLFLLFLLHAASEALAFTPEQCFSSDTNPCSAISIPEPAGPGLFTSYFATDTQPASHCGNTFRINYDSTLVELFSVDTRVPTGQDFLFFEVGAAFEGSGCPQCDASVSIVWRDNFIDPILLPVDPFQAELVLQWQYFGSGEPFMLAGVDADQLIFIPGCVIEDTQPLSTITSVPEPGFGSMLICGGLFAACLSVRGRAGR